MIKLVVSYIPYYYDKTNSTTYVTSSYTLGVVDGLDSQQEELATSLRKELEELKDNNALQWWFWCKKYSEGEYVLSDADISELKQRLKKPWPKPHMETK